MTGRLILGLLWRILHATKNAGRTSHAERGAWILIGSPNQVEAIIANVE